MSLTDTRIRTLKPKDKVYRVADANGLTLEVKTSGVKVWRYRYRIGGKPKMFTIGEYGKAADKVSLLEARNLRDVASALVKQGIDPVLHRKEQVEQQYTDQANVIEQNNKMTFEGLFKLWHEHNSDEWTYEHAKDIRERVEKHLLPNLGSYHLDEIKPKDVIKALKLIEITGRIETTKRVKQYAKRIFSFGIGYEYCEHNPASDLSNDIFKSAKPQNYPHTTDPKVLRQVLIAIDNYVGHISTLKALQLAPYVFLRSKEIAGIKWMEIDLDAGLIEITSERMKKKRAHIVPISKQALEVIIYMKAISSDSEYLFPSSRTKQRPINEQSLNAGLHRIDLKGIQSFHGFRHTASTMLNEMGYVGDIIEKQLAHEESNKVRGTYNKAQYLPQRMEMMQGWGDYLEALKGGSSLATSNKAIESVQNSVST